MDAAMFLAERAPVRLMGILNVTPDSFSDGGTYLRPKDALQRAHQMVAEGVDIIDIGGESTRPRAQAVPAVEQLKRVLPVIRAIREELTVPISIDSSEPLVMEKSVAAGANFINDVRALRHPDALQCAADLAVPVCLMHMQGEPMTMQQAPHYHDVVAEVIDYLRQRIDACLAAGIKRSLIVVDPGFGFGKNQQHHLRLMQGLEKFVDLGPVLVGVSRKSMIARIAGREPQQKSTQPQERLLGSIALALIAAIKRVRILRVHDVAATAQALRPWHWITQG